MTGLPAWADLILGLAALLVALGTLYRYVIPALRGLWRLAHGTYRLVEDFRETGGFAGLSQQNADLAVNLAEVKKELYPNGGSSMRDAITRNLDELRGYAAENRNGIAELRERVQQIDDKVQQVDDKAQALGERQEVLRATDQQYAADLKHYISTKQADLIAANEHLRAALNEVLAIDDDEL